MPPPIKLSVFSGAFNWPIWVATERGLFARNGIAVETTEIPGSIVQWTNLAQRETDVLITLMDNVIAYREGQGEAPVTVSDAVAVMAADAAHMPALIARPGISSYQDLKGETLSVDAAVTGLAPILFALLEKGGLATDDYRLVRTGGVLKRFEGLKRHEFAASVFNAPFASQLVEAGFHQLDTAASVMRCYQGHVVATRRSFAESNERELVGFIRALAQAIDWLYDPANRDDAFAIFRMHMPGGEEKAAQTTYAALFDPQHGFVRSGIMNMDGIADVIALRSRFGTPARPLAEPGAYFDPHYLKAAHAAD